jgi:uncharacterized protein (DUF885 family)
MNHGSEIMKHVFAGLMLFLPTTLALANPEDVRLEEFFKTYLEEEFHDKPLDATRLGDHRFDDRLDDVSAKAREGWTRRTHRTLEELPRKIDHAKLSRSGQIDYEIFKHNLTSSLWLTENTDPFRTDPRIYTDYISDSVFLPLIQSTIPRPRAVKSVAARMAHIPALVKEARANLGVAPRVFVETAIKQNRGSIGFYQNGIYELAGETAQTSELKPAADRVVHALKEHQKFLEEVLLPRANGEWRIGKEKFARKLELELDAGLTAEQVLREAETEFDRVERDLYVVSRQLWSKAFPGKTLPPDDVDGRRGTTQQVLSHYNREHGQPEDLVRDARGTVERIKQFIKTNDIVRLPEPDRCQVIEMPEFQRGNTVAYLNPAPPLDVKASSFYAISPPPREWDTRRVKTFLEEYNRHMLQLLTIHEAYPGHYVQLEYSNRHPSLIRKVLSSGVFAEGWAVYTEQMMLDQGYGGGDLVLRLSQLKWYLRAVANAILDHKMHCSHMTDEEALEFLTKRAFQSEAEAVGKIIRSKQSSCQLSTYFVGRTAFYRLRQQIQREQGDQFDLGRYHEAVLEHGTLPVKYLPELVRERLKKPR